MISVDIDKQLGDFALSVTFQGDGGVTALFGPSGSGKTSVVGMIAGLIKPDRGRIVVDGETVFDSARGIHVPAHRRRIGTVFQDGRLFPHLSVARNLDYGRWMTGLPRDEAQYRHVTELLDIAPLVDRRPGALSGGERQRVALGRALLMKPRLMLLDEPLASLDAGRKNEILPYLVRLRDDTKLPMIYVSHDAGEVKLLASRVVLLDGGRVVNSGGVELLRSASS
ncbi:molybdenum ABC transporter ATP-binding protein [Undibacter mobilis]|uniref:Molybdenum ABC transporter ATP-binding protein n=1 Tax=Undibacter mobilis TaxID=2292256 RepID=A0A371BDT0_9BRAD|nr:molybdenum ABC transporter ATP-binding protein [Undibacter mobilis]RDV05759.1 molybdenum ABC transporter ATP-binding protein [Undibacter mobilis]